MRAFKKAVLFSAVIIFILSACSESAEMKIYNHLEEAVTLEQPFEEQQDSIIKLEQEEQEIYEQIISLSMEEFDEIKKLAEQAMENIDKRSESITLEKDSLEDSKEEVLKSEKAIDKLEDSDVKAKAEDMYQTMIARYDAYDELHGAYTHVLGLEKELYSILTEEEAEQETLTEHLSDLNNSYEAVIEANEQFNEHTVEYNELKREFYQLTDLDIEYEED